MFPWYVVEQKDSLYYSLFIVENEQLVSFESFNALPYDLPKGGWPPYYWYQDCVYSGGVWNRFALLTTLTVCINNSDDAALVTKFHQKRWHHTVFTALLWDEYWALAGDWGAERNGPRCVWVITSQAGGDGGWGTNWLVIMGTLWQTTSSIFQILMGI